MTDKTLITTDTLRGIDWTCCHSETVHSDIRPDETYWDEFAEDYITKEPGVSQVFGFTFLRGTTADGLELELGVNWGAYGDTSGPLADLYDFTLQMEDPGLEGKVVLRRFLEDGTEGAVAVTEAMDEDGDHDGRVELDILEDIADDAGWEACAREVLPAAPGPEDIDVDEESDMETYTLTRDGERDVRFTGKLVAGASSHHYEGPRNIRWTEISLYKTQGGTWIAQTVGRTLWQGEHDRHSVVMADTDEDLIDRLGTGWLAKEVYEEAGIDTAVNVD